MARIEGYCLGLWLWLRTVAVAYGYGYGLLLWLKDYGLGVRGYWLGAMA